MGSESLCVREVGDFENQERGWGSERCVVVRSRSRGERESELGIVMVRKECIEKNGHV